MPFAECIEHMYLKGLMGIREFMVLYPIKDDETEKIVFGSEKHVAYSPICQTPSPYPLLPRVSCSQLVSKLNTEDSLEPLIFQLSGARECAPRPFCVALEIEPRFLCMLASTPPTSILRPRYSFSIAKSEAGGSQTAQSMGQMKN